MIDNMLIIILLTFFVLILLLQTIGRIIRRYYKFPVPALFTRLIDNPIRRKIIQKPKVIAERMQLKPGLTVVEIGSGKGNYTKVIAEKILPNGTVYAVDIQESVINYLKNQVEKENIPNIVPMIDDAHNFSFEDESVDRILAICTLPEIPEPVKVLREFKRILKPQGIVSLCELFPDLDYPRRKTEKRWAEEAGLKLIHEFGNWFAYQLNFGKN